MQKKTVCGISRRAFVAAALPAVVAVAGCAAAESGSEAGSQSPSEVAGGSGQPATSAGTQADSGSADVGAALSPEDEAVQAVVSSLSIEQKVAQLFVGRIEAFVNHDASTFDDYVDGLTAIGADAVDVYAGLPLGGVCAFSENLVDPDQTRELLSGLSHCSNEVLDLPLFIAVDEEGGLVARISGNPAFGIENVGSMRDYGDAGDEQTVLDTCAWMGTYLSDLGFSVDFAPVCDITNNPDAPVMYERSFGDSAEAVVPMVRAAVRGFSQTPVRCCAKHFPGIGGAVGDSHDGLIVTHKTFDEMEQEEFQPFVAAIEEGVDFIMVGHIGCPEATGTDMPASLNADVIEGVLRQRLGYQGIVLCDSLEMGAVVDRYGWDGIGVATILAGNDLVLMPPNVRVAYKGVLDALAAGTISEARIDESVRRVVRCKLKMAGRL